MFKRKEDGFQFLSLKREIYVNKKLLNKFNKYFGYRRYIFNRAIELHSLLLKNNYGRLLFDEDNKKISFSNIRDYLKRNSSEWESEYSKQIIETTVEDYFLGYERAVVSKDSNLPKFKKKITTTESFRFNMKQWNTEEYNKTFTVEENRYLRIPRFKTEIGRIKLKEPLFHGKYKNFPNLKDFQMTSITIKREADRYYAVFRVRFAEGELYKDLPELAAGLDVGIRNLATISYREKKKDDYNLIIYTSKAIKDKYDKYEKKISWYLTMLNRKQYGSKLWLKTRTKLQRVYRKIVNFTEYHHHKITSEIVNRFMYLSVDMFKVMDMVEEFKFKKVRERIYQNNTYRFYEQLVYKYDLYGGVLIEPDDDFNSTNKCSCCKYDLKGNERITLSMKNFKCPKCGFKIDRDINASINLERYLLKNI